MQQKRGPVVAKSSRVGSAILRSSLGARFLALIALVSGVIGFVVLPSTPAFANAANPSAAGVTGSVVINGDGSVSVTVSGTWTWSAPAGNSSVNFPCGSQYGVPGGGHFAVGWGMIWNDTNDPGYIVKQGSISEGVGSMGNTLNPQDETAHTYTIQFVGNTHSSTTVDADSARPTSPS